MKMDSRIGQQTLDAYIRSLQAKGRYTFSFADAMNGTGGNRVATKRALLRLSSKRRVASVYRGFYLVIPFEYAAKGIVPADWFVDDLFAHLAQPYYAGLLTAAAMHGSAHQQPQEYQVIVSRPMRDMEVRGLRLRFFVRRRIDCAIVEKRKTQTGYVNVSDPASTSLDLVRFHSQAGGWDRIRDVYEELGAEITADSFLAAATREPVLTVIQRSCWLLDQVGCGGVAEAAREILLRRGMRVTPLDPSSGMRHGSIDERWKIIVNRDLETA